jgi:hypothetical protein
MVMKSITQHYGTVGKLERMNNSGNGNPRFRFTFDGYDVVTAVDAMHGYCIQNLEGKECVATIGTHRGVLTLDNIKEVA